MSNPNLISLYRESLASLLSSSIEFINLISCLYYNISSIILVRCHEQL